MSGEQDKMLGFITESVDDRLRCIAIEHGLTREEAMGWVVGIGLTVLEVASQIPDGKLVYFNEGDLKRITLPTDETHG